MRRLWLAFEFSFIFLVIPFVISFHPTRLNVHVGLWIIGLYAIFLMRRSDGFSWRAMWRGKGWPMAQREIALLRFVLATLGIILLTCVIAPQKLFSFPLQRPVFWLLVMVLYPVLSVVPQEFVFRAFFFRRYEPLFKRPALMVAISAFIFGYVHTVFHNPVSPILSAIAGAIFGYSYLQHRSLKWAAIEHAAYGCMVFTVGLGSYFLVNGGHL
jgi:membrane protease YdiL (CAAX protease family)